MVAAVGIAKEPLCLLGAILGWTRPDSSCTGSAMLRFGALQDPSGVGIEMPVRD
jgi:hypothetical protein